MTDSDGERTIPLYEERVAVTKTEAITDSVRVSTRVEEREIIVEGVVERGGLSIERVAVDRPVEEAPAPRQEGDTLIVSVVEERLVVEKRLFVIEELRITRTSTTDRFAIPQTVRSLRATVEHVDPSPATGN